MLIFSVVNLKKNYKNTNTTTTTTALGEAHRVCSLSIRPRMQSPYLHAQTHKTKTSESLKHCVMASEDSQLPCFRFVILFFMDMNVFLGWMCTMCVPSAHGVRRGVRPPENGVIEECEPQCRCWEPNSSPFPE